MMATVSLAGVASAEGAADAGEERHRVEDLILHDEDLHGLTIEDSTIFDSEISAATVMDSRVLDSSVEAATIKESVLEDVDVEKALLMDSRVEDGHLDAVTLRDVTVCDTSVNGVMYDDCQLVSVNGGDFTTFARIEDDAPDTVKPGESYDIVVEDAEGASLTVENTPAGLIGLGFETDEDPLGLQKLGFEAAADNESVQSLELIVDGEVVETFQLGETVELPDDDFTLRVNVAEEGIIDHARLALELQLDDGALRPATTNYDVMATQLAFAPMDKQLFAPFVADDVARLVLSVPTDEHGNVDRDVNISTSVDVKSVDSEEVELTGDMDDRARLHDDSRLFSEQPFLYMKEVDAAHHPQTLELLVRENLNANLEYGAINVYGTHLVAMSPFATNVTISGEATNAEGEELTAEMDIHMPETSEEQTTRTFFGEEFMFPGEGTIKVNLVDENGNEVEAEEDWELFIQETPSSHTVRQSIAIEGGATSVEQDLAESVQLRTPLGNFVPSEYLVCVEHDGERDCAQGGDLVSVSANETTEVDIVVD